MSTSKSSRSRSSAPTPHFEPPSDPPKPSITPEYSSSARRSIAPSPYPFPTGQEDQKPSHDEILREIKDEEASLDNMVSSKRGEQAFRRSRAPEFEMGDLVEGKVWPKNEEVKSEEQGEMGPPSLSGRGQEVKRERSWTPMNQGEYGGGFEEEEEEEEEEAQRMRDGTPRSESVNTLFSRNEDHEDEEEDRDGREIDYDDEEDEGGREGITPELDVSEDEEESENSEFSDDAGRRGRKAGGHLTSEKRKRKAKGRKGREPKKSKKELERERVEQAAQRTSDFFSQLPIDPPQPALISIKARLTNHVAASSSHLPPQHQVLSVKQPSPRRRRRTPTPPTQSRSASPTLEPEEIHQPRRASSAQSRPTPIATEDDLEDYSEEDPLPPPEELLDGFRTTGKPFLSHDFVSEVGKPRRLESREQAIERWKLEIGLEGPNALAIPESYSWISYRRTHSDLVELLPSISPPLPPLISLPRTFEAHPLLLSHLPPSPTRALIWSTINGEEELSLDSNQRLIRACWQLKEFYDSAGLEQVERDAEKERIGLKEFEEVAKEVFGFDEDDGGSDFDLERLKERNWIVALQIVQLSRIHRAYHQLSSAEIVNSLTSARHGHLQRLSTDLERVKSEYEGIEDKRSVGNSMLVLRLREKMEAIEVEMEETRTKFDRLEQSLRRVR